jgi:excisionase family DNA binding protein
MIMSVEQASAYLHIRPMSLRALARDGKIPAGKFGRVWRFNKEDLDNFLRQQYQVKQEEKTPA